MILRLLKVLELSVEESIAKTTHIGDDFDLLSRVPGLPPLITYLLSACGSRMNGLKQFISTTQIELLRRLVTPSSITAFLNRAVGNFFAPPVIQKIESFVERKTGDIESMAEMLRRGGYGPGVNSISDLLLIKLQEGSQEMDGEMSFVKVPVARALERCENGGLGCFSGFDSRFDVLIKKKYPRRIPNPREHTLTGFRNMPRFASSDLSSIITPTQRQVIEDAGIGLDRILNDVHQTIKQTSWPVGSRQHQLRLEHRNLMDEWFTTHEHEVLGEHKHVLHAENRVPEMEKDMYEIVRKSGQIIIMAKNCGPMSVQSAIAKRMKTCIFQQWMACYIEWREWVDVVINFINTGVLDPDDISKDPAIKLSKIYVELTSRSSVVNIFTIARGMKVTKEAAVSLLMLMFDEIGIPEMLGALGCKPERLVEVVENIKFDSGLTHLVGDTINNMAIAKILGMIIGNSRHGSDGRELSGAF